MYFDLNLKYIRDKYTYYTLSSRYETLVYFALVLLRETCVCSGHWKEVVRINSNEHFKYLTNILKS